MVLYLTFRAAQNMSHEGRATRHSVDPFPIDLYLGNEEKENRERSR